MRVFVILFNARTDNEGIHTLRIGDRNTVLMFETEDDATRFALMLEAQDFPPATVERIDDDDVIAFCRDADYDWQMIGEGELAVPPENIVDELDWSPEGQKKAEQEFSASELDRIRRRLEGLL
jgi:Protein of unknown function (DUF3110)